VHGQSIHILYLLIAAASICLFWLFRSGNLFLGDGVTVAKVARTDEAFRYYVGGWAGHITSHQVLDYWIARNLHRLISPISGFESYETIALRSCFAGGIFVFAVLEIGRLLFDERRKRIAFSAVVFTTGAMQLFFGYVETYSLATAFLSLFCLATLLYARGKSPIWAPVLLLVICASLHLLTLGAGLALLFAYLYRSRARQRFSKLEFAAMAAVPLLLAAIYFIIFHSMGFSMREIFYPAARKEYEGIFFLGIQRKGYLLERYTLFSLPHLIDIANEILLVSSFGLFLCLIGFLGLMRSKDVQGGHGTPCRYGHNTESGKSLTAKAEFLHRPEPWILFLTAAAYLAVTLVAAPLLGARKDWDVFAPPWIFISMLGVYLFLDVFSDERFRGRILLIVVMVSLLGSAPWILSNARVDLDEYLAELGKGDMYLQEGLDQRALEHFEQALQINFSPELAYKVARLRMKAGDMEGAERMLKQAIREENRSELALFLEQEDAHFALGSISLGQGQVDDAISHFNQALDLWQFRHNGAFTHAPDVYYHLGVAYLEKQDMKSAEEAFVRSIESGDVPLAHLALAKLYARDPERKNLAQKHLSIYLQKNPADAAAAHLFEGIKEIQISH
jgi:tetratricopeptide (TPR) repeat protein